MGSDEHYAEERPVHEVEVDGFWIDDHQVTVAEFRRFVKATGHVTVAERGLEPADYPDADPALLVPGSLVFRPTRGPVDLDDYRNWWHWVPGAQWRHPEGPGSDLAGRDRHPVTHVAYDDATAYAAWAGKTLPTEAEWEYAARGGLDGAVYTWGDEFAPKGRMMANTWQGEFPWQNLRTDNYEGTSPVKAFPPNGYGLFDMAGNVWEWTDGLLPLVPPGGRDPRLLRPIRTTGQPQGHDARRVVQRRPAGCPVPADGRQGRLAPVRPELLPPLPAGGAAAPVRRDVDGPPGLPLHQPSHDGRPTGPRPPGATPRRDGHRRVRGGRDHRGRPGLRAAAEERVAVFDNDGTLWCEKPMPIQLDFTCAAWPRWPRPTRRCATSSRGRRATSATSRWLGGAMVKHYHGDDGDMVADGRPPRAFAGDDRRRLRGEVADVLHDGQHPTLKRPYRSCGYQPMVELLRYLEANGFATYIASGGDRDFMRAVADELYGIPPERVIGSALAIDYHETEDGNDVLYKSEMDFFDDGPTKPVRIWSRIGRRPLVAGGNSNGDLPMLRFAHGPDAPGAAPAPAARRRGARVRLHRGRRGGARARPRPRLDGHQHQGRLDHGLRRRRLAPSQRSRAPAPPPRGRGALCRMTAGGT